MEEIMKPTRIVVIGAGPIGLLYASWIRLKRPDVEVTVLEAREAHAYKIGESTLSGFCKALRSIGISQSTLQRHFYVKNGLGFFHVNEDTERLQDAPEYILETFDETFQVERQVLDQLIADRAVELGVSIVYGARVRPGRSRISASGSQLVYTRNGVDQKLDAKLVVDASGPAAVMARHFGQRVSSESYFQTTAVWGSYQGLPQWDQEDDWRGISTFPRDQYTQHVCFKEGWFWLIPLRTDRLSVGLVLRNDREARINEDPTAAFLSYQKKYPAVQKLLEGLEPRPLGESNRLHHWRKNVRNHSRMATGAGWLSIGDAAFFVDPLISPGLTAGAAMAYQAVCATIDQLETGAGFQRYQSYVKELHEALERDNQLVYMSFNHPRSMALIQQFQEIDARRHFLDHEDCDYTLADTNVWGILTPGYQRLQRAAWEIMREAEDALQSVPIERQHPEDYCRMHEQLCKTLGPYLRAHPQMTPYVTNNREQRRPCHGRA
jgi:flavin-dependent dehydrogenase